MFESESFRGDLLSETEECSAHWTKRTEIPYHLMWDADRAWLPLLLSGKPFHRAYVFNEKDEVVEERDLLSQSK